MIYAISNQKGGVAKTTSCFTIGNILASKGKRVLMIDMDPQSSLTLACGVDQLSLDKGMYNVMVEGTDINDVILNVGGKDTLFLAPSTIDLSAAELHLVNVMSRETILKQRLAKVKKEFDYILIDCSPSLGLLVVNCLTASDKVIIPCAADYLSYKGLTLLLDTIQKVKGLLNPNLSIMGVIVTMFASRTLHCKEVLEVLSKDFNILGVVGTSTQVKDSFLEAKSIFDINPKHPIAKEYINITEGIING